jgi:FkbM family methyltransferase
MELWFYTITNNVMLDSIIRLFKTNKIQKDFKIRLLNRDINEFETIFDVGSYHGEFVDYCRAFNDKSYFHCFEPYSESYKILVDKFKGDNKVILNNYAVSNVLDKVNFNVNSYKETNSLFSASNLNDSLDQYLQLEKKEVVNVITLDKYCFNKKISKIDLLKIDAQGSSFNVVDGFRDFLKNKMVKYIYLELEFIQLYQNQKLFSETDLMLNQLGYQIIDLMNINYLESGGIAWCDALYKIKE